MPQLGQDLKTIKTPSSGSTTEAGVITIPEGSTRPNVPSGVTIVEIPRGGISPSEAVGITRMIGGEEYISARAVRFAREAREAAERAAREKAIADAQARANAIAQAEAAAKAQEQARIKAQEQARINAGTQAQQNLIRVSVGGRVFIGNRSYLGDTYIKELGMTANQYNRVLRQEAIARGEISQKDYGKVSFSGIKTGTETLPTGETVIYNKTGRVVGIEADLGGGRQSFSIEEYKKEVDRIQSVQPQTAVLDTKTGTLSSGNLTTIKIGNLELTPRTQVQVYTEPKTGKPIQDIRQYMIEKNIPFSTTRKNNQDFIDMITGKGNMEQPTYDVKGVIDLAYTGKLGESGGKIGEEWLPTSQAYGYASPVTASDITTLAGGGLAFSKLSLTSALGYASSPLITKGYSYIDEKFLIQPKSMTGKFLKGAVVGTGFTLLGRGKVGSVLSSAFITDLGYSVATRPIETIKTIVSSPETYGFVAGGFLAPRLRYATKLRDIVKFEKSPYDFKEVSSKNWDRVINIDEIVKESRGKLSEKIVSSYEKNLPEGIKLDKITRNWVRGQVEINIRDYIPEINKISLERLSKRRMAESIDKRINPDKYFIDKPIINKLSETPIELKFTDKLSDLQKLSLERFKKSQQKKPSFTYNIETPQSIKNQINRLKSGADYLELGKDGKIKIKEDKPIINKLAEETITFDIDIDFFKQKISQQKARLRSGADIIKIEDNLLSIVESKPRFKSKKGIEIKLDKDFYELDKLPRVKEPKIRIKNIRQSNYDLALRRFRKNMQEQKIEEGFKEVKSGEQILLQKLEPQIKIETKKAQIIEPELKQSVISRSAIYEPLKKVQILQEPIKQKSNILLVLEKEKAQQKNFQNNLFNVREFMGISFGEQKTVQKSIIKQRTSQRQRQELKIGQIEEQILNFSQPKRAQQKSIQNINLNQRQRFNQPLIFKQIEKPRRIFMIDENFKTPKRGIKKVETYSVSIKRRGKFKTIGGNLGFGEALKLGELRTRQTLGRTFKIQKTGFKEIGIDESFSEPDLNIFRRYKVRGGKKIDLPTGTFIQKTQFSLSGAGEKREIQQARQQKRQINNLINM